MEFRKTVTEPGLNPRDALDILEIRARETEAYLVKHADVGDGVLEYLAQHGAPATRQAVAASVMTPRPSILFWPATPRPKCGPNWRPRSRG
jgi:hypothetical protein